MDNSKFGLNNGDLEVIVKTLSLYPEIDKAVIFGSRAIGNYKPGSDVDIALFTTNSALASKISYILNDETLLPYKFDVIDYFTTTHDELNEHIDRVGIVIYNK